MKWLGESKNMVLNGRRHGAKLTSETPVSQNQTRSQNPQRASLRHSKNRNRRCSRSEFSQCWVGPLQGAHANIRICSQGLTQPIQRRRGATCPPREWLPKSCARTMIWRPVWSSIHTWAFRLTRWTPGQCNKSVSTGVWCRLDFCRFPLLSVRHRFRPIKGRQEELKELIEGFKKHDNLEKTFRALTSADWARNLFLHKTKAQEKLFKQHVNRLSARSLLTAGKGPMNNSRSSLLSHRCLCICGCLPLTADLRFSPVIVIPPSRTELKSWQQKHGETTRPSIEGGIEAAVAVFLFNWYRRFTGKETTRSSIWWDASPSSRRARKTCCSATARTTSASCIPPARTAHSSGSGRPPSSITVLVLVDGPDFKLLVLLNEFWFLSLFAFSDCRPNCKVAEQHAFKLHILGLCLFGKGDFNHSALFSLFPPVGIRPASKCWGTSNQGKRSRVTMEMASLEKTMNFVNATHVNGRSRHNSSINYVAEAWSSDITGSFF